MTVQPASFRPMVVKMREPASRPCGSCPYRKDVPSGVWAAEEYDKLPAYDLPTSEQPLQTFGCHQQDGRLCAGWVATHDMDNNLSLRIATAMGHIDDETCEAVLNYKTDVELWESGEAAAEHGQKDLDEPSEKAQREIEKLQRKLEGRI